MTDEPQTFKPLYSSEAEESIIGSILLDPEALETIDIQSGDFYFHKNGFIWDAIRSLQADNCAIDYLTIVNKLERSNQLTEVGGRSYVMSLINQTVTSMNVGAYVGIVKELSQRRSLESQAQKLLQAAHDQERTVEDTVADITTGLTTLSAATGTETLSYGELLSRHYDRTDKLSKDPASAKGMQTGFIQFDDITGGVYPGEFLLFYGKPKVKKTQFLHQLAEQMAGNGHPVAVFQVETPEETIMNRDVSRLSLKVGGKITTRQLETGQMNDDQWPIYTEIIDRFSGLPIYINFGQQTTASIEAESARLRSKYGLQAVFIDYMRLLGDSIGRMDEWQRQEMIALRLKRWSRRSGLAVICIHNLVKSGIASAKPSTEDGSGGVGISYDCDKSIFITEHIPQAGETQEANMRTFIIDLSRRAITRKAFNMIVLADYPCFSDPPIQNQYGTTKLKG